MSATVWLVSSREWPDAGFDVGLNGGTEYPVTAALGGLYLVHPTAALDLLARFVAMMANDIGAPEAFITEQRYVRLRSGAGSFSIEWSGSTVLRDYLGFTGDLSGSSAYTAQLRSPLLWSPGKTETPGMAILGSAGRSVVDVSVAFGQGGRQTVRQEGPPTIENRYSWAHVPKARYLATAGAPVAGDWVSFWETELVGNQRIILLRGVTEGSSTTTSAGYGSATSACPYKADMSKPELRVTPFERATGFERVEAYYNCTVPVVKTPEFA